VLRYRRVESFSDTNLSWHGVWSDQYGNLYRRTLIYHPGFWNFVLRAEEQKGVRMEALKFYLKDRRRSNLVGESFKGAPDELAGWNAFSDAAAEHNAFTELCFSGTVGVPPLRSLPRSGDACLVSLGTQRAGSLTLRGPYRPGRQSRQQLTTSQPLPRRVSETTE